MRTASITVGITHLKNNNEFKNNRNYNYTL